MRRYNLGREMPGNSGRKISVPDKVRVRSEEGIPS